MSVPNTSDSSRRTREAVIYRFVLSTGKRSREATEPGAAQEDAVDAVIEQCQEAFRDDRQRPTMGTVHARMLTEDGVTDPAETERWVRAEARRWIEGTVRREYGVDYEQFTDRLERQVPSEIARKELERAPRSPTTPVQYREGMFVPACI